MEFYLRAACLALALCAAWAAPSAAAEPQRLNLLSWGDYFDPKALEEFTAETGIVIAYDVYSSTQTLEAKLRGKTDYDVAVAPGPSLQALIAGGGLRKLDKAKLSYAQGVAPEVAARLAVFDPGNQYGVPYLWFTNGLAFDVDKARAAGGPAAFDPASWDVAFRPERLSAFADCGVSISDSPSELFPVALRYLRLNPASRNEAELRRAGDFLSAMRRTIGKFGDSDYAAGLANGEICLAVGSSLASLQARARAREAENGVDIGYALPKEGALMSIDALAIPLSAPHPEAALAFINFMLRPEIAARNTNATNLANSVPASRPWIAKDIAGNKAIYPDPDLMGRLFSAPNPDAATQKFIAREWARVKTGKYP
ncbi:extracellular solute-binding protein family 1 [Methylocella silvestris BL2]|uniref:Putrescine-binding periplasmic protein n=1 Tax=Methylocella silvestris (strain DSM 15510 / CIP 108128 / LMG 27833 / NCIMB 13906 / BL2) TaxID=395965 RepID=B8ELU1_METSB|nr:extracellular solute-binding protein [Methylocella silvestris]ACK50722.1 extracellular solute-binding protein family 1 [Methylocella silvestris BL2]